MRKVLCLILTTVFSLSFVTNVMANTKDVFNEKKKLTHLDVFTINNYNKMNISSICKVLDKAFVYENITEEINQIKNYIDTGCYIEAIQDCERTLAWHYLSPDDINLLNNYKIDAQNRYNEYLKEINKYKWYYYNYWSMGFTGLASYTPTIYANTSITIYDSYDGSIWIDSWPIGQAGDGGILTSDMVECADVLETSVRDGYFGYIENLDLISATYTTVGGLTAYQKTYRITEYVNRYNTQANYTIVRTIVFKYGNYIYCIYAYQDEYLWTTDFYNLMEKFRTSIRFY